MPPIINLGHIDKLRMLRIACCWGVRLQPVDPNITFICYVNREIPQSISEYELAKESQLR